MKIAKSADVPKSPVTIEGAEHVEIRWLISKDDGAENFAMRMFEVAPGGTTPLHSHHWEHEVFILEGSGLFVYEGQQHEFGPEHVIFVPPGKQHCFKNTGDGRLRFLCVVPENRS